MSAIAAFTLLDGAATPVARTFSPVKNLNGVATYAEKSGGIAIGYPTVSISLREPTKNSRIYRATKKTVYPVLEVTSPSTATGIQPAPTLAHSLTHMEEFFLSERCTPEQRDHLIALVKNSNTTFPNWQSMVKNLESTL